jgi:DNA-binding protein H-NS
MKTYAQLTGEIARLQARADELRKAERADMVRRLREMIALYGITAADLGLAPDGPARHAGATPNAVGTNAAKLPDSASSSAIAGLGDPPAWIASTTNRMRYLID